MTKAERALKAALNAVGCSCEQGTRFYTATEWKAKGESYCRNSKGVLVFEESNLYGILNAHYEGRATLEGKFSAKLRDFGFWYELGTSWYLGLYETTKR